MHSYPGLFSDLSKLKEECLQVVKEQFLTEGLAEAAAVNVPGQGPNKPAEVFLTILTLYKDKEPKVSHSVL